MAKRNFGSMIQRLVELKIIDSQQMQMLAGWRVIRNDFIHAPNISPTQEQTLEVIDGVRSIVSLAILQWLMKTRSN